MQQGQRGGREGVEDAGTDHAWLILHERVRRLVGSKSPFSIASHGAWQATMASRTAAAVYFRHEHLDPATAG